MNAKTSKDTEARTFKEALIAQMLGELDALLHRVEALPKQFAHTEESTRASIAALVDAGERYREVIYQFNEQSKAELTNYLERTAATLAKQNTVSVLTHEETKKHFGVSEKVIELAFTAAVSSIVTATLVLVIMRIH